MTTPTPIQQEAIPPLLDGRDAVAQARTGSGKTLAFALPLVEICDPRARGVQALVLVPTRELAIQVGDVIRPLAESRGLRLTLLYGGRSFGPEQRALRDAQVVVGTPGRTLDHLRQRSVTLPGVRLLVLDEADEMLDRGFARDVEQIISFTPKTRQTALFSATMPEWVMGTAEKHLRNPVTVSVDPGESASPDVEHLIYDVAAEAKLDALTTLLDQRGENPVIVFGRTKHGVKKLAQRLVTMGYPTGALQGNLSQNARERVLSDFRAGRLQILLATNVAARGLDVQGVERVINYELPESPEWFTHRVGRTGRMGRKGEAITLLTPEDAAKWRQFEKALNKRFPRRSWATGELVMEVEPRPTQRSTSARAAPPRARTGSSQPRVQHPGEQSARPTRSVLSEPARPSAPRRRRFAGRGASTAGRTTAGPAPRPR